MAALILTQSNALHMPLRDKSIHCCITSPPYYGLRAYAGVEPSCWPGGSYVPVPGAAPLVIPGPTPEAMGACTHAWGEAQQEHKRGHAGDKSTLVGTQTAMLSKVAVSNGTTCLHCHCWYGTLGNEGEQTTTETVYELRKALTPEELGYVIQELAKAGITLDELYGGTS